MADHEEHLMVQEDAEAQRDLEAQAIRGLSNAYLLMPPRRSACLLFRHKTRGVVEGGFIRGQNGNARAGKRRGRDRLCRHRSYA